MDFLKLVKKTVVTPELLGEAMLDTMIHRLEEGGGSESDAGFSEEPRRSGRQALR